MSEVRDIFDRPLGSLRISVTDRCNLRCGYCMPEEDYVWLEREQLLTFEEIARLAAVFASLGANKIRLTGGEPLLRRDLDQLVRRLAAISDVRDLALTTNGVLLPVHAQALRDAGLRRVTVSLDTLDAARFERLTRRPDHARVIAGLRAVRDAGFDEIKLNTVVMRGFNDDELAGLIDFGREIDAEIRFIEYMDVGGATRWSTGQVVSRAEMLAALARRFGTIEPIANRGAAPAERYALSDGTTFGIIASTTAPFCGACDRSRLTVDGTWLLCLYARDGIDLRGMLRAGASTDELIEVVRRTWRDRNDRGAEERAALDASGARAPLYQIEDLRREPRREMHTRGG